MEQCPAYGRVQHYTMSCCKRDNHVTADQPQVQAPYWLKHFYKRTSKRTSPAWCDMWQTTHGDVAAMQSIHSDTISTRGVANWSSRDIPLISFVRITSPCDLGKHVVTIAAIRGRARPQVESQTARSVLTTALAAELGNVCPPGIRLSPRWRWDRIDRKRWSL
eukprot:COSAG02_NODE_844_length_16583_cov_116.650267_2_plen_163_part_00